MLYAIYGYKVPNYIFFTFINDICKKYNLLDATEADTEDVEEQKSFLKLNLRYCIEKVSEDDEKKESNSAYLGYCESIAEELFDAIEKLDIIKTYLINRKNEFMKKVLETNFVEYDVMKHIFMKYSTTNYIDTIKFKSVDLFIHNKDNPNYEVVTGVLIDEFENIPYYMYYSDEVMMNAKDIIIELFNYVFNEYKSGLIVTNYNNNNFN
jgi:hypothetical protein